MTERTEEQLRDLLFDEAADVSSARDFAQRVALEHAVVRRERRRRGFAVAGAVAVAAAVAVIAAAVAGPGADDARPIRPSAPAIAPSSPTAGIDWVLVDIAGSHGHLDLVAKRLDSADRVRGAWLELDAGGSALLSDGVNVHNDRYSLAGSTLRLHQGASTSAALAPGHSDRATIVTAMDALDDHVADIGVRVVSGRLVLRTGGYVLTFRNAGPSRSDAQPHPQTSSTTVQAERIYAPNVVGGSVTVARHALDRVGLRAEIAYVDSKAVAPGVVVTQTPSPAIEVATGSAIELQVSRYKTGGPCSARQLSPSVGGLSPATGEHGFIAAVTNIGSTPCTLDGFPRISITDANGSLPFQYQQGGTYVSDRRPTAVVLQPGGGKAWFAVAKYRCDAHTLRTGATVNIDLPGVDKAKVVLVKLQNVTGDLSSCSGNGNRELGNTVHLSPIVSQRRQALPS